MKGMTRTRYIVWKDAHSNLIVTNKEGKYIDKVVKPQVKKSLFEICAATFTGMFVLLGLILMLQGCSYTRYQSETTTVTGLALFNKSALSGLHHENNGFVLDIESYEKDNTSGVSAIVEGTIRGMK